MKFSLFTRRGLGENLKLLFFCVVAFGVGAVVSLWWFFPTEQLLQRVVQEVSSETGIHLQGENAALVFPLGLRLDATIQSEVPELNDLEVTNLRLTPVWSSLVSRDPAARVRGTLAGGDFTSVLWRNNDLNIKLRDIALLQLLRADLPYRLRGSLFAQAQAEQLAGGGQRAQGDFQVTIREAAVLGLEQIGLDPDLPLGQMQFAGQFSNMRLNLEQAVISGGAIDLNSSGTVLIGATPAQTRLNLNVRIQPTAQTPPGLRDLLSLTGARPGADGSYQLQIGGTLATPVIR